MKFREEPSANYKCIYLDSGKTIRIAIDPSKPITELKYPEFYDIKLTNHCNGQCPYCYQYSSVDEEHYDNIADKLRKFFSSIPKEHLPYQIAYGGGEPTSHPEFIDVLKLTKEEFDITPNYTTNGTWISKQNASEIVEVTKRYCGGVAVSCHPHLDGFWSLAAAMYSTEKIRLNLHIIISDKDSIDRFIKIFNEWKNLAEYFVLLPHMAMGRAKEITLDWEYFVKKFPKEEQNKIAFGANFYPYLLRKDLDIKLSLYEPEIMSKYLDLKDSGTIYSSSFSNKILKTNVI